jgi:ketosteroid isomerase-like protein
MSQENVEVVKRSVEAYLRGDIDAYLEGMGDDVVLDFSRARGPYRGVHRGREGARELFAVFWEAFS